MNTFTSSQFPAALPQAEGLTLLAEPSMAPYFQEQSGTGVREARTRQWESLKKFIHQVYIKEDKPFPYLAKKLKDEHSFHTTRKQFSRKIEQWGFRKNIGRSERLSIMRSLPRTDEETLVRQKRDARLNENKLKNWKKRYMREINGVSMTLPEGNHAEAIDGGPQNVVRDAELQIGQGHQALEFDKMVVDLPGREPLVFPSELLASGEDAVIQMDVSQDSWPFDWSTVDVTGSPGLSRLFRGLRLESEASIPPISLDEPEPEDGSCLSKAQMGELFEENKWKTNQDRSLVRSSKSTYVISISKPTQRPAYPYRDVDKVFFGYSSSPLNEIYVFPTSPSDSLCKPAFSGLPVFDSLEIQQAELESQLSKLEKQFPITHSAVLTVMEDLANMYYNLGKVRRAESMYRKLVDIIRGTSAPDNLMMLRASVGIIDSICEQGRYTDAQSLVNDLRLEALKLLQPHHEIVIEILESKSIIAGNLRKSVEAERLRREILQINLSYYGPRHDRSINAMSKLGREIEKRSVNNSEMLHRTAVQLSVAGRAGSHLSICQYMRDLAEFLHTESGLYEESHDLAAKAIETFTPLIGARHTEIFGLKNLQGWNMYKSGRLEESETLFRTLASIGPKTEDGACDTTSFFDDLLSEVWYGLGGTLYDLGNANEAVGWLEKAFHSKLSRYRANDSVTISRCYTLCNRYEHLGHYDDALNLYRRMIDEIRELGEDPDGAVADFEYEIARIEEYLADDSSDDYDNSDQSEWQSDDSSEDKERQPEAETDDVVVVGDAEMTIEASGKESTPENEDWKTFICEDEQLVDSPQERI